jgi:hypothetical protein
MGGCVGAGSADLLAKAFKTYVNPLLAVFLTNKSNYNTSRCEGFELISYRFLSYSEAKIA